MAVSALGIAFSPLLIVLAVVGGLIAAYITNFFGFRDAVNAAVDALKKGDFKGAIEAILVPFEKLGTQIYDKFKEIGGGIGDWAQDNIIDPVKKELEDKGILDAAKILEQKS
jgi:hypothetical protein